MHQARAPGGVLRAGILGHLQRIQVRAQGHTALAPAPDDTHYAGPAYALAHVLDADRAQTLDHEAGGLILGHTGLGACAGADASR